MRAETARHALQLDMALRAWAENDLVRANALLDDVAGPFQQTWEQRHLRELCRRKCLTLTGARGRRPQRGHQSPMAAHRLGGAGRDREGPGRRRRVR